MQQLFKPISHKAALCQRTKAWKIIPIPNVYPIWAISSLLLSILWGIYNRVLAKLHDFSLSRKGWWLTLLVCQLCQWSSLQFAPSWKGNTKHLNSVHQREDKSNFLATKMLYCREVWWHFAYFVLERSNIFTISLPFVDKIDVAFINKRHDYVFGFCSIWHPTRGSCDIGLGYLSKKWSLSRLFGQSRRSWWISTVYWFE